MSIVVTKRITPIKGTTLILLAMALIAMGLIAGAPAFASPAGQAMGDMESMNRLKQLTGRDFEIEFMNMMIMHHQHAVDASRLAPDRSNHQEVKTLAQSIIESQTREINDMTNWLKQWYDATPQKDMGMMHEQMHMQHMKQMESLSGDAFDKEFLTMMRMHHMEALEMAELIPDRATHEEMKTLGRNIITSQSAEIRQMEEWLKAWYNLDATSGMMPGEGMHGGSMAGEGMHGGSMAGEGMMGSPAGTPLGMPRTGSGDAWTQVLSAALVFIAGAILAGGLWLRKRA